MYYVPALGSTLNLYWAEEDEANEPLLAFMARRQGNRIGPRERRRYIDGKCRLLSRAGLPWKKVRI